MPYKLSKVRGKDLYKVVNIETKEIKSSDLSKQDAKKQISLLRSLERKERKGGSLKASQLKDSIDLTYKKDELQAPKGYEVDKELSNDRTKVFKDLNSNQVIVAHRGSKGWRDWFDNMRYGLSGNIKGTGTYKIAKKNTDEAVQKYGADNIILVGHSRAGKYAEEYNRNNPVKEVLTYNKAIALQDAFQKNPSNQTDIRNSRDVVSVLQPLQQSANKAVNIGSNTFNLLKAHGTSALGKLGDKLIGKGVKCDRMIGGSVWTDFVKEFALKHSLKYACALSKWKEQLKKAYKLKKEGKDWYEPITDPLLKKLEEKPEPKPEPNIKIEIVDEPKSKPKPKPNIKIKIDDEIVEELDNEITFPILVFQTPKYKSLIESIEKLILKNNYIIPADLLYDKASQLLLNNMFDYWSKKVGVSKAIRKIDEGVRNIVVYLGGENQLSPDKDLNRYIRHLTAKNKRILDETLKKEVSGGDFDYQLEGGDFDYQLEGGNRWTDFVKDYAKKLKTTYGCALSDIAIKPAYKLFKEGKDWYIPLFLKVDF